MFSNSITNGKLRSIFETNWHNGQPPHGESVGAVPRTITEARKRSWRLIADELAKTEW